MPNETHIYLNTNSSNRTNGKTGKKNRDYNYYKTNGLTIVCKYERIDVPIDTFYCYQQIERVLLVFFSLLEVGGFGRFLMEHGIPNVGR